MQVERSSTLERQMTVSGERRITRSATRLQTKQVQGQMAVGTNMAYLISLCLRGSNCVLTWRETEYYTEANKLNSPRQSADDSICLVQWSEQYLYACVFVCVCVCVCDFVMGNCWPLCICFHVTTPAHPDSVALTSTKGAAEGCQLLRRRGGEAPRVYAPQSQKEAIRERLHHHQARPPQTQLPMRKLGFSPRRRSSQSDKSRISQAS